jgi:hypothetical protein
MNTTLLSTEVGTVSIGLDLGYFLLGFAIYRTRDHVQNANFLVIRAMVGPAWLAVAFRL